MSEPTALFDLGDQSGRPIGEMERTTREQLRAIAAGIELTPQQLLTSQTAIALAVNIDRGNLKGRSIGNEAAQLLQAIAMLTPDDDAELAGGTDIPNDAKELMNALGTRPQLAAVPRLDRTEERDTA